MTSTATSGEFAKFTSTGLESATLTKSDVNLDNVENTALSSWVGSSAVTTLGTISTGTWNASTIASSKIDSGITAGSVVKISSTATADQFAKFTSTGLQSVTLEKTDVTDLVSDLNTITNNISSNDTDITTLQALANTHESSIGLDSDGGYTAIVDANYASSGASLKTAVTQLDTQVKTNALDIETLEIRDGGLILQTDDKGIHMPATIMLSSHAGPFRIDFAQAVANNGGADLIFYGTKAKSHEDKFFTIDTTSGDASFTG